MSDQDLWLTELDPKLWQALAQSATVLSPVLDNFRLQVPSLPLTFDMASLIACAEHLDQLLNAFLSTDLARRWNPDAAPWVMGTTSLRGSLNHLSSWLLCNPNHHPRDHEFVLCCDILTLALDSQTVTDMWHGLFTILALTVQQTPSHDSHKHAHPTPYTDSSLHQSSQLETGINPLLRIELHNLLYPDTPKFFETFFPLQTEAFAATASLRGRGGRWTNWPPKPAEPEVIPWLLETTDELLESADSKMRYYTYRSQEILDSDANGDPDIVLHPVIDMSDDSQNGDGVSKIRWKDIRVVGELKESTSCSIAPEVLVQLMGYIREIFISQYNRRFVHAFTLTGQFLRCWIFHRGGGFGSELVDINKRPHVLVDVFTGYARMSDAELGYDTGLRWDKFRMAGTNDTFTINPNAIFSRKTIASRGTTVYDLTKTGDDEPLYVLKDAWRHKDHNSELDIIKSACERDVEGIIEYVAYEEVVFGDPPMLDSIRGNIMRGLQVVGSPVYLLPPTVVDREHPAISYTRSTSEEIGKTRWSRIPAPAPASLDDESQGPDMLDGRGALSPPTPPHPRRSKRNTDTTGTIVTDGSPIPRRKRVFTSDPVLPPPKLVKRTTTPEVFPEFDRIHTRILMRKGRHIFQFHSPVELLYGLHDALVAHRALFRVHILHRDISILNIMLGLHPQPNSPRGYLIDLDMAIDLSCGLDSGAHSRIGTREFMAIGVLRGEPHTFRHDVESFFFVFVWVCVYGHWWHKGVVTPLGKWATGTMAQSALAKEQGMRRGAPGGWQEIEAAFMPWAQQMKGVAERWREVLFRSEGGVMELGTPGDEDMLYDPVLRLLREGAEELKRCGSGMAREAAGLPLSDGDTFYSCMAARDSSDIS